MSVGFLKNDSSTIGTGHKIVSLCSVSFMEIYYDILG
jgi:hypothetical protein